MYYYYNIKDFAFRGTLGVPLTNRTAIYNVGLATIFFASSSSFSSFYFLFFVLDLLDMIEVLTIY